MTAALVVVLLALLAGGGVILVVMRRNGDPQRGAGRGPGSGGRNAIDPFTVNEPWRRFVQDALQARTRFVEVVAAAPGGPVKDRLVEIGRSLDAGVTGTWATARQGQQLREARRRIDTNQVRSRLKALNGPDDPNAEATRRSLEAQLASAERLDAVTAEAESKLRLMQAQLDGAVAQAAELSVRAGDVGELAGIGAEISGVADQLEALRLALQEVNGGPLQGT